MSMALVNIQNILTNILTNIEYKYILNLYFT